MSVNMPPDTPTQQKKSYTDPHDPPTMTPRPTIPRGQGFLLNGANANMYLAIQPFPSLGRPFSHLKSRNKLGSFENMVADAL